MTSKEALNSIADKCAIKEYDKDGNLIKWAGTIDKEYLTIMQDLEVLDALKRNVGIRLAIQEWANKETKVFPNDRKIVKEWLNNDK